MAKLRPGYIFGMELIRREKSGFSLSEMRKLLDDELRRGKKPFAWGVSLKNYAMPGVVPNFRKHLQALLSANRVFRALDVGIGPGSQWDEALNSNPHLELWGVVLSGEARRQVVRGLKKRVKVTPASGLHRVFPAGHFNLVVSFSGFHGQPLQTIEAAMHVLRPGGEAILTTLDEFPVDLRDPKYRRFFDVIASSGNSCHLRKKQRWW